MLFTDAQTNRIAPPISSGSANGETLPEKVQLVRSDFRAGDGVDGVLFVGAADDEVRELALKGLDRSTARCRERRPVGGLGLTVVKLGSKAQRAIASAAARPSRAAS